ncbi:DUF1090 domain-containing protein [Diaphorobacter ruginosibacter]|uniref:DUF1090 domain-containing protein n=1 Tax=Diaphorobacter ruginosibacter TaxID=1715720 RepID=UPI003341CFA1
MKNILPGALFLLACASPAFAAERSAACEAKRSHIESQISHATAHGRSREVAGLKRALAANKAHYTDASLAKERDARIRDAQRKVAEREKGLAQAEHKGDAGKIAARKAKLEQARNDLIEAQKPIGP